MTHEQGGVSMDPRDHPSGSDAMGLQALPPQCQGSAPESFITTELGLSNC